MRKKVSTGKTVADDPNEQRTTSSKSATIERAQSIGYIPYIFFLSFSMLVTFLILMNNKNVLLSLYRSIITTPQTASSRELLKPVLLLQTHNYNQIKREDTSTTEIKTALPSSSLEIQAKNDLTISKPNLKNNSSLSTKKSLNILSTAKHCPKSIEEAYRTINESKLDAMKKNTKWCQQKIRTHHIQIGRSWGSLSRSDQQLWDSRKCNEILSLGTIQSCEERYGWKWFENWLLRKKQIVAGGSNIHCIQDYKTTSFCKMEDVVLDFHKMVTNSGSRSFPNGFLNFYGTGFPENQKALPTYPGMKFFPQANPPHTPSNVTGECDYTESRPTFILSNDDIFNLGHYMNDVMGIWSMIILANRKSRESLMINFDGYRYGGPAGGGSHRLMLPGKPDEHGPYSSEYFHKWFNQQVKKARDYEKQKVCFHELYIFPLPGVAWFWNEWSRDDDCSLQSASPLYQSFNVFLRQNLLDSYESLVASGAANEKMKRLVFPSEKEYYHIVIEVRSIKANNRNGHSSSRFIKNLASLVEELSNIDIDDKKTKQKLPIKVTAQDFSKLSFADQIHLAHSASVLISMHGAGTTHIFHMAIGDKKCCALMELFPDTSVDLYTAKGYGNLARMLGLYHERYVTESGQTKSDGTFVNTRKIKDGVTRLLNRIIHDQGSCLHNVKDTRNPIFSERVAL